MRLPVILFFCLVSSLLMSAINIDDYHAENALTPLDIPSYTLNLAGQREVVHPDVAYVPAGWKGYKYWMAYTPFPDGNPVYENPCIAVSNDRINWIEPPLGTNPIDSFVSSITAYNSDTELMFSPDCDSLYCIWRRVESSTLEILYYKSTANGYTWSPKTEIMRSNISNMSGLISPAFVYQNGKYRLWSLRKNLQSTTGPRVVEYREANSLRGLASAIAIPTNIVPYTYNASNVPLTETWHFNVIYHNDYYWMINTVGPYGVPAGGDLYLGYSADGINWTFGAQPVLAHRDTSAFWDCSLYRASILPIDHYSNNFDLWYSVQRKNGTPFMIGLTHTTGGAVLHIELTAFTATLTHSNKVRLEWITKGENAIAGYNIHRNTTAQVASARKITPTLIHATNSSSIANYSFTDQAINSNGVYYYWLENVNMDGTTNLHESIKIERNTSTANPPTPIKNVISLKSIYPNPCNSNTTITFDVLMPSNVHIEIYNIRGGKVLNLLDQWCASGSHMQNWDGKDQKGKPQPPGIYFIKMSTPDAVSLRKTLLLK